MFWIPLSFFLEFGFGQLFKWAQQRGCFLPAALVTNYLTLALLLFVYFSFTNQLEFDSKVIQVGSITGFVFIVAMLLMTKALSLVRVGSVLTSFRMAILIPILFSVAIWGETAEPIQIIGIGLSIISLILMTQGYAGSNKIGRWGQFALILLVFFGQGASMTCLRWVRYAGLEDQLLQVIMVTGAVAGSLGVLYLALIQTKPSYKDISIGAVIGTYNLFGLIVLLTALNHVSATVFFPLMGCVVVTLDNLAAHFYWREKLDRQAIIGVGLALIAIILVG
ncbi:MAG: hypothetical protein CME10_08870 [Gemmatimonadetes bacterium]|nr:hypothetical protein [Gemmatimonadota bacterium]